MAQYIYGKNVVKQILKERKKVHELILLEHASSKEMISLANAHHYKYRLSNRKEMDRLVGDNHQGVIAVIDDFKTFSVDEIIQSIPQGKVPLLVMLDGLEDPHNLGAILRTCDAIGVDGVIIGKHRSVGLTATVAKVSTGAIDTVKVAQVTNLTQTLKTLKQQGYWVCGADSEKAQDYRLVKYDMPLVLVIGSEGFGLSRLVKENCDFSVKLPMVGKVSSLNASVATAVLLYQIYNQRFPL